MLIRCSSLGKIMPDAKAKGELLSVGAQTYLKDLAKEIYFGYGRHVTSKPMTKGITVEQKSIELYNSVHFLSLTKNTARRHNGLITGEPDLIIPGKRGIDIKSSWSLDTFPILPEDCHDSIYEWQARGYMALWDLPEWEIAFCMVSTPEDLCQYESRQAHNVDHIDPQARVTSITYKRDMELEGKMMAKAKAAQEFIQSTIAKAHEVHGTKPESIICEA